MFQNQFTVGEIIVYLHSLLYSFTNTVYIALWLTAISRQPSVGINF